MMNCELELDLSWTKDCVLIADVPNVTGVKFMIRSTKLSSPLLTFSNIINKQRYLKEQKNNIMEQIKT